MGGRDGIQTQAKLTTMTSQCTSSYGEQYLPMKENVTLPLPSVLYDKKVPEILCHDPTLTAKLARLCHDHAGKVNTEVMAVAVI